MATAYGVFIQDREGTKCYPQTRLELVHRGPNNPVDALVPYLLSHKRVGFDSFLDGLLPKSGRCVVLFFTSGVFGHGNGSMLIINGESYELLTCKGKKVFDDNIFSANVLASINLDIDAKKAFLASSTTSWEDIGDIPVDFRPMRHDSIDGSYGLASSLVYGHAKASNILPKDLETAARIGTMSDTFALADHVHKIPDSIKATGLKQPITINGVIFDGTKNITIPTGDNTRIEKTRGVTTSGQKYLDGNYGINLADSDLIGINGIYFADQCDAAGECISFPTATANMYDRLYAKGGYLYFHAGAMKNEGLAGHEVLTVRGYQMTGQFDRTNINPTATGSRLNYNGDLYAGRVYNAIWNDYAEAYSCDKKYEAGTVLSLDTDTDEYICTISQKEKDPNVFGVVSDEYGICLGNKDEENSNIIALCGRVHVKVVGTCKKGDYLVTSEIPGVAKAIDRKEMEFGIGFARVLEPKTTEGEGKVLCAVFQGM